ncbi:MAG: hypothetical protein ACRDBG_09770 [Waterburya sp.]
MASVLDFYSGQREKITKIVDTTLEGLLGDQDNVFSTIAPVQNYADAIMLIVKFSRSRPTIASLVGDEQELPTGRARIQITEEMLSEARIGKQHVFTNNDFKAMKRLEQALQNNLSTQARELRNLFFGIAGDLAPSIVEKVTVLLMEVLTKGSCNFIDPITEVRFNLSYPDVLTSGINQLMFTANPAAPDAWNVPTTGNAFRDIDNHAQAYGRVFGDGVPIKMYIRKSAMLDIRAQAATRQFIASKRGYGATAADLANIWIENEEIIEEIERRLNGGKVTFLESMYSSEDAQGSISDNFFLADNTYFFAEDKIGERAFVPTPEKDFAQGIYVNAKQLDDAPRKERIAGVGSAIPAIWDARKLAARKFK